jgi:hypothetical protein
MPTLQEQFVQFRKNLRIPDSVTSHVSALLAKISTRVQGDWLIGQPIKVGSFERRTSLVPIKDVDLLVVLNERAFYQNEGPAQLLQRLDEPLERVGRPSRIQPHSVGVDYEGYRVEFVPALQRDGDYLIPELGEGGPRWIRTNPPRHGRFTGQKDQELGAMGVPIVQMMKQWKHNRSLPLKSFHLEMMALQALDRQPASYAEGLQVAFQGVARFLRGGGCPDPGLPAERLGSYLSTGQRENLAGACENAAGTLAQALHQERYGYHSQAIQLARNVFGSPFPG